MATPNMFDLLNDDAQDQEIHIPAVKKAAPTPKPKTQPGAAPSKPADNRGPRKDSARPPRRDNEDREGTRGPQYDRMPPKEGEPAPRPPRGSRNSTRGARGGRHGGYDRHSATGMVDSEKKLKQGWGEPTVAALQGEQDAENEVSRAPSPEPVEPEAPVKTLDDYLQEKASKALKIALPTARAANAGSDQSQWKNAKVLEVEETGDFIKMSKDSVAKARKGKKDGKVLIQDINFQFSEPAREPSTRGGRGERGGRGGRGGRGSGRGGGETHQAFRDRTSAPRRSGGAGASVDVKDPSSFPTLGSA
ncbi:hypothetical protein BG005_008128 [Podila minutissima]|nr:hypothetical protein BG005_008128 [Podila minutissima]